MRHCAQTLARFVSIRLRDRGSSTDQVRSTMLLGPSQGNTCRPTEVFTGLYACIEGSSLCNRWYVLPKVTHGTHHEMQPGESVSESPMKHLGVATDRDLLAKSSRRSH